MSVLLPFAFYSICSLVHTVLSSKCPNITLSDRSTSLLVLSNGSNHTLYQEFVTDGNVWELNITWTRIPFSLDPSTESFGIENRAVSNTTLRASLSLWDIQLIPDDGVYTVVASHGCGASNQTTFKLHIDVCEEYEKPQPLTAHNVTVIAEPQLPNGIHLVVIFRGESDSNFLLYWTFGGSSCLEFGPNSTKYSCYRTPMSQCLFGTHLWITNATYADSDNYTVRGISTDDLGNASTVELRIVRLPLVKSCTSGPLNTDHKGHVEFVCQVSNYSEYVVVVIVENDSTEYTNEVELGCVANGPDTSLATCTVNISTSQHSGSLMYTLCVGLNASVHHRTTQLQCSDDIAVTITMSTGNHNVRNGLIAGGACLALLLSLVVAGGSLLLYRVKRQNTQTVHNASKPLLTRETSEADDVTERDHTHIAADRVVPLWPTVQSGELDANEFLEIARAIAWWETLARHLGLTEADIVAISENNVRNYEEQKYQMLLKWREQQSTPPTKQDLVQIIEEKMKDSLLAQKVGDIVGRQQIT